MRFKLVFLDVLEVIINDVNDNSPSFDKVNDQFSVNEEALNAPIGQVLKYI